MWKQDILDGLARRRRELAPQASASDALDAYMDALDVAEDLLREAQVFHFGGLEEAIEAGVDKRVGKREMRNVCLPFPAVLFEWNKLVEDELSILPGQELSLRRAVLFKEETQDAERDMLTVLSFSWFGGRDIWEMDPEWIRRTTAFMLEPSPLIHAPERWPQFRKEFLGDLSTALECLDMLHCMNIGWKTVEAPEKLNRKRVRNGREPYDSYHVVEVGPGRLKSKELGREAWGYRSSEGVRLHMCRGHFKTYTEDKPLFGKYTGSWWWQPQARGKAELGRIDKEWHVHPSRDNEDDAPSPGR